MVDERVDVKLSELARQLLLRPLVPGYFIVDSFTMRGVDESAKPGLFAAVLLGPEPAPELDTLTRFRQVLTARLKQLSTTLPGWPIVVQGTPELIDGQVVVPGGREYFEQLKGELQVRKARHAPEARPVLVPVPEKLPVKKPLKAAKSAKPVASGKKLVKHKAAARSARPARSARTARPARAGRAGRTARR